MLREVYKVWFKQQTLSRKPANTRLSAYSSWATPPERGRGCIAITRLKHDPLNKVMAIPEKLLLRKHSINATANEIKRPLANRTHVAPPRNVSLHRPARRPAPCNWRHNWLSLHIRHKITPTKREWLSRLFQTHIISLRVHPMVTDNF